MSVSSIIDSATGKIFPELVPAPGASFGLGEVLQNNNSANDPTTGLPQDATDFKTLGCVEISTGLVFQGNFTELKIGDTLDTLQIKGATELGSILVGNGANTEELVCPTTSITETTNDIYNWLSLANGQSKTFGVSNASLYQLGYSITILYSGTDSITGTITAVGVSSITITITSFTSQVYTSAPLITTTPPDPTTATSGGGDPVFIFNGATTTPNPPNIPPNSFLLSGTCYLYSQPAQPPSNISLTAINNASALVNPITNIFSIPVYENPPVSTSAFNWGSAGCFFAAGGQISLASNTGGNIIAFAFPTGGSFIDQNFTGEVSGYTLAYSSGTITINSKLVLTADNTKPLGVFWGVDAQGVGTITSVSAGTNINVSGSLSAPVVNFATPTTSNIQLGVGTEIIAVNGDITMSIDSTGLNDKYINGGVVNEEDIAVSSTSVVNSISTTNATTYQNSSVITCNTALVSDIKTAVDIATTATTTATTLIQPTGGQMGVGSAFTAGADGSVILSASTTNPIIQLSQSAPFATSYITTIDKDGIIQNNSAGNGFRCRSAQDIYLEPTNGQPNPQTGVIRIPNGNSINMSVDTYTTTYRKDGVGVRDTFAPSSYDGRADFYSTNGTSAVELQSEFIGTSKHTLDVKTPLVGNAVITHSTISGASRNLVISSQGNITTTASSGGTATLSGGTSGNASITCSTGAVIASGDTQVFASGLAGAVATPNFTMRNSNTAPTSYPSLKLDKSGVVAPALGTISAVSSWAVDATGTSREWSRIQTTTENTGAGNQDGTLQIWNSVNGAMAQTFNFNGAQNENNSFRPLDMNGNGIRTTSGDMTISTLPSTGTGFLSVQAKDYAQLGGEQQYTNIYNTNGNINLTAGGAASDLVLTCPNWESATANAFSGKHLRIKLNGVYYKIALLDD